MGIAEGYIQEISRLLLATGKAQVIQSHSCKGATMALAPLVTSHSSNALGALPHYHWLLSPAR